MGTVHSVSFKKSEKELMKFALSHDGFSEYIKCLIEEDRDRCENIFTRDEIVEIKRMLREEIKKL